jgi:predicted  nucleic acid-binding Zn-ribbon protein
MIGKIAEIDAAAGKLELMVKSLVEDRERAWAEVARLKKALDEREMEFLQMDEEFQNAVKGFDEERAAMREERAEAERRLDEVSSRVRTLLPLLPEIEDLPAERE